MKAYIKTALRRRLCLEYSYFDKLPQQGQNVKS